MLFSLIISTAVLTLSAPLAAAQAAAPAYGQCGGQGWTGPTTCVSGYTCSSTNQWYSQCLPGSNTSNPPVTTPPVTAPPVTTPPVTTTIGSPPTTTTAGPAPTGSQIRTVTSPVYHFYLQNNGGVPRLGPESSSGKFTINGTITLNQSSGVKLYLNLDTSTNALSFGQTATTTNWGLEGDTIIIKNPRQLNFLACSSSDRNYYDVFLQGSSSPPGRSCTMVTMHLPCLC